LAVVPPDPDPDVRHQIPVELAGGQGEVVRLWLGRGTPLAESVFDRLNRSGSERRTGCSARRNLDQAAPGDPAGPPAQGCELRDTGHAMVLGSPAATRGG